jgi:hypothetical protein
MAGHERGRLLPSDEGLNHQTVDTFATVSESDLSWTEKLWATVFAPNGSVQIDAGLGKYPNRNVLDGFGGASRDREQWTVRASRELARDPETTAVGPIHYEVVRPLEAVRFWLEPTEIVDVSFEFTISGLMPPLFEERDRRFDPRGQRIVSDLLRYHQPGSVSGWLELEGERHEFDDWVGFRDHSWGVRRGVGTDPTDIRPARDLNDITYRMHWAPFFLQAPGREPYELSYYRQGTDTVEIYSAGALSTADGNHVRAWRVTPDLQFHPEHRRLQGGEVVFDLEDGTQRVVEVEPMGDTGFHLGTGLYLDLDGKHHGTWMGKLHVEGEHFADLTDPHTLRRVHQLRDCVVRAREGDAVGWGTVETVMTGAWPQYGLAEAAGSFV